MASKIVTDSLANDCYNADFSDKLQIKTHGCTTMNPAPKQPDLTNYSGRFAARLRQLREKAGLSVEQVVEAVGKANKSGRNSPAVQSYYGWEQGKSTPHWDLVPAIAKALKVEIHELLPGK